MIEVKEISIREFQDDIYHQYVLLFPEKERREWKKIERTYAEGIEKFYKILLGKRIIGFFLLETLGDSYPFYLDYFAIFEEFQNQGYGSKAIEKLCKDIVGERGVIGEIEKVSSEDPVSFNRYSFYKRLGFREVDSEYLLYQVLYTPIVLIPSQSFSKEQLDSLFFDYYRVNCGDEMERNCKIIR